ncbi:MAG: helix-turn-helix transcriptional regulator, partial [Ruminococcaceae bacterium]|nr:helix-turn-helix transcriptional regulator [Oscillospiraceae bacterium]
MANTNTTTNTQLLEIALRIKEMREIEGYSVEEMAEKVSVSPELYRQYESASADLPFTFIHKCALTFGIEITDLLEGQSAHLSSYTVTRKGQGKQTAKEDG